MPTLGIDYGWDFDRIKARRQRAHERVRARYPNLKPGSRDYENAFNYQMGKR